MGIAGERVYKHCSTELEMEFTSSIGLMHRWTVARVSAKEAVEGLFLLPVVGIRSDEGEISVFHSC